MASSKVQCPQCSKPYTNKPELQGRKVSCKKCGQVFRMPGTKLDPEQIRSSQAGKSTPSSAFPLAQPATTPVPVQPLTPAPVPIAPVPVPAQSPAPTPVNPIAPISPASSTIHVACPNCQQSHSVAGTLAGQPYTCSCGSPFMIPAPTVPVAPAPIAPATTPVSAAPITPPVPTSQALPAAAPPSGNSYWNREVQTAQPKPRKIVKKKIVREKPKKAIRVDINAGLGDLVFGLILFIVGVSITVGTYVSANPGGIYYIAYGPVIWGAIHIMIGLAKIFG